MKLLLFASIAIFVEEKDDTLGNWQSMMIIFFNSIQYSGGQIFLFAHYRHDLRFLINPLYDGPANSLQIQLCALRSHGKTFSALCASV